MPNRNRRDEAAKAEPVVPATSGYDWIKATVHEGRCRLDYRVTGLHVDGRDGIEDDVSDWTDEDIRDVAAGLLALDDRFKDQIKVVWD